MVCAIELGLVRPPTVTNFTGKLETRKTRFAKHTTREDAASKLTDLAFEESRLPEAQEISSEENHQNNLLFQEHQYSLPPAASSAENIQPAKVQNIYCNEGKKLAEKTTVYNPLNALHNLAEKSNYNFFTKHAGCTLGERFKYGDNKTSGSIRKMPPKRKYFRHKRKVSSCTKKSVRKANVDSSDERSTDSELPIADICHKIPPPSSVIQDFTKLDIYEVNRTIKNQTGPLFASPSTEESSESDDPSSQSFPEESIDATSWKNIFTDRYKKARPPTAEKVPEKLNKEKRSSVHELEKEEETFKVPNPAIDSEDSEIDETLLVDPSTDLPGALLESDDQANENIDLNPQFDVNFDMSFETQSLTPLNVSFNRDEVFDSKTSTTEEENSSGDETETQKSLNQTKSKDYWEHLKKNGKDNSSFPQRKKRRSADSMVRNNGSENKENYDNKNCRTLDNKVGRITRRSAKNSIEKETSDSSWPIGSLVWGSCMGWWPGLIVAAEDVGMYEAEGKSWIFWIAENRISHLRDKTQIQSFSAGLRSRMIETLRVKSPKDANYSACLATAKLLNDQILQRGPLTKPHHAWVEKHVATCENIDQLILHPYPPAVRKRLDELKEENSEATEKYLSEVNENAEKISTRNGSNAAQKAAAKPNVPVDPGHLPLSSQKPGVITWAKIMGQIWWPAMIIDFRDCGMKEPNFGCQWILWYGDYTLSQVNHRFFLDFETGMTRMKEHAINSKREVYRRGVVEAAKDYCLQFGYRTDDWSMQDVFDWFSKLDEGADSWTMSKNVLPGIPGNAENSQKYPARIVEGLRKHKGNCTVAAIREHNIKDSDALLSLAKGKLELGDLCLMCLKSNKKEDKTWTEHPFFEGSLCQECLEKYAPTIFAYGDDGKCFFCTVCAGSDTVVICDEHNCPRVYCTACLKYLIAPRTYDEIMLNDPFHCFLCEDSPDLLAGGLLKPRGDWKTRIAGLFHGKRDSVPNQVEYYKDGKKRLRVLSLFDGISSGLVVLEKLGIQVDAYYASEINPDAEMVSSAHFGERIIRLGDVRSITEEKIREIAPIHLLIGGSPCNDLSLVNPMRLGIHDPNGTGILVYEYRRVKNLVEKANGEQHFFWLFENVASMPTKYRLEINEILGREPDLIDAANYSPQHRPRLYWSNFPVVSYPLSSQDLQDVLTKNCNRHALVKKIRTVTTRVNSLKQGKESLKPILMNEENDTLWITELEAIFGFPRHYTDVKNLCATKRQKLIGKSWSIQTIAELMRPLCNFFQTRSDELP